MIFSILLLLLIGFLAFKTAPQEKKEDAHVHGAGQIGLLAAVALFGVDYFTSFYYGTGEMMSALHPYGLQQYGYIAAGVIAFGNIVFGALYMYSLGVFNEGGGSYTASMRYLWPTLSLIVAVTLIQDYVLTIVVSALLPSRWPFLILTGTCLKPIHCIIPAIKIFLSPSFISSFT